MSLCPPGGTQGALHSFLVGGAASGEWWAGCWELLRDGGSPGEWELGHSRQGAALETSLGVRKAMVG